MPINAATQQDTETLIFQAGIPTYYSWWHSFVPDGWDHAEESPHDAPDGWAYVVTAEDPEDEDATVEVRIGHGEIMKAAREITRKEFDANSTTKKEAFRLQLHVDDCDIDAVIADAILQVAVYGKLIYG